MAKNTQETSNTAKSALQRFIEAGQSEIDFKGKGEVKASLALAFALLASDDADTLNTWRERVADYHTGDDKMRERARISFADYVGATQFLDTTGDKERKTQDYRNLMERQYKRMQFACDVHALRIREYIVIHENAKGGVVANVKGGSELASRIWTEKDWTNRKVLTDKRSPMMDILIAQRSSQTQQGEVSWSALADMVAKWSNRKGQQVRKAMTVSAKAPLGALKAVSQIISNADMPVHFSSVESRMQALETGEDVLAFALEGDDPIVTDLRKTINAKLEELRDYLQSRINAKAKLATAA